MNNVLALMAVLLLFANNVFAQTIFEFTYHGGNDPFFGVIEGSVAGTLQEDGNTVFVSSVIHAQMSELSVEEFPSLPVIKNNVMTLDGTGMTFSAWSDETDTLGLSFHPALYFRVSKEYCTSENHGCYDYSTVPSQWSMKQIPTPATLLLLMSGVTILLAPQLLRCLTPSHGF